MSTPTVTPQGITTGELLRALLAATGRQTATKAAVDDLRAELLRRFVAHHAAQGTAPRERLPGVGEALLTDPQDRVVVTDPDAFANWAAEHHPEHVTATLAIPAPALEAVLDALEGVLDPEDRPVALAVHGAWVEEVAAAAVVADGQVIDAHGQLVAGMGVVRGTRNLSVKLDPQAKARAAAEAVSPEGLARITADLPDLPGAADDLPGDVVHQLTAGA